MTVVDGELVKVVSQLAKHPVLNHALIKSSIPEPVSNWPEKRTTKELLQLASSFRTNGQFGRLRTSLLVGLSLLGEAFLTAFERRGLLLSDDQTAHKFTEFLALLREEVEMESDATWRKLGERLNTYEAYRQLVIAASYHDQKVSRLLRTWPRHIVRTAMIVAELSFIRRHFDLELPQEVANCFEEVENAEEMAGVASLLIAQANSFRLLDGGDLGFPAMDSLSDPNLWKLIRYGHAQSQRYEIAKMISLFSYRLQAIATEAGTLFYVRPAFDNFEYFLRLGFMRNELSSFSTPLHVNDRDRVPEQSLMGGAESFVSRYRNTICRMVYPGKPFRYLRVQLTLDPELLRPLFEQEFYDDAADEEMLSNEFLLPVRRAGEPDIMLTEKLDLETFLTIWRIFHFLNLVDVAALKPYAQSDRTAFINSLVRVTTKQSIIEMIASLGIAEDKAEEFVRLVSADVHHLGYYDMQYRPLLLISQAPHFPSNRQEFVHPSAIAAASNIVRNVQTSNQIRLPSNASLFVDVVARTLRSHFQHVTTNRRVASGAKHTDIDIVALQENDLFLFECKHSVSPTGAHELRDIWEEIEKGVQQIETALATFSDTQRRHDYLTGWFPRLKMTDTEKLRIFPCILCSHRIFGGLEYKKVPVRDFASFALLLGGGVIRMGMLNPQGTTKLLRHRITNDSTFASADLVNYLSSDARYFGTFKPFMHRLSRLWRFGAFTVARDTYAYEIESDSYCEQLEAIGCTRLADEEREIRLPAERNVPLTSTNTQATN